MSESEHSSQGSESGISPGSDSESSSDILEWLTVLNQVALIQGALLRLPVMVLMIDFQILHGKIL